MPSWSYRNEGECAQGNTFFHITFKKKKTYFMSPIRFIQMFGFPFYLSFVILRVWINHKTVAQQSIFDKYEEIQIGIMYSLTYSCDCSVYKQLWQCHDEVGFIPAAYIFVEKISMSASVRDLHFSTSWVSDFDDWVMRLRIDSYQNTAIDQVWETTITSLIQFDPISTIEITYEPT